MPSLRSLRTLLATRHVRLYATQHKTPHTVTDNPVPANNPSHNVTEAPRSSSSSNTMPITTVGAEDRALQEAPEEGEQKRLMQAPNRAGIWSRSQQPRGTAMSGPRFEQTIMEDQVCSTLSSAWKTRQSGCVEPMANIAVYTAKTSCGDQSHPPTTRPLDEQPNSLL
jgi:hypothetical protein